MVLRLKQGLGLSVTVSLNLSSEQVLPAPYAGKNSGQTEAVFSAIVGFLSIPESKRENIDG